MTDIKIPHEHRNLLDYIRDVLPVSAPGAVVGLVNDLIAAAKADAPEPPEIVLYRDEDGDERVLYRQPDGALTAWRNGLGTWIGPNNSDYAAALSRCTPLVPTVDADGLEKAAIRYYDEGAGEWEADTTEASKSLCRRHTRAILGAAGVAVEGETDGAS